MNWNTVADGTPDTKTSGLDSMSDVTAVLDVAYRLSLILGLDDDGTVK